MDGMYRSKDRFRIESEPASQVFRLVHEWQGGIQIDPEIQRSYESTQIMQYVNDSMMHQEVGQGDGRGGVGAKRTVLGTIEKHRVPRIECSCGCGHLHSDFRESSKEIYSSPNSSGGGGGRVLTLRGLTLRDHLTTATVIIEYLRENLSLSCLRRGVSLK